MANAAAAVVVLVAAASFVSLNCFGKPCGSMRMGLEINYLVVNEMSMSRQPRRLSLIMVK